MARRPPAASRGQTPPPARGSEADPEDDGDVALDVVPGGQTRGATAVGAAPGRAASPAPVEEDDVDDGSVEGQLAASAEGLAVLAGVSDAYLRVKRLSPAEYGGQTIVGFVPGLRIEPPFNEEKITSAIEEKCGGGSYQVLVMRAGRITECIPAKLSGPPKLLPDPNVKPEPEEKDDKADGNGFTGRLAELATFMRAMKGEDSGMANNAPMLTERISELRSELNESKTEVRSLQKELAEAQGDARDEKARADRAEDKVKDVEARLVETRAELAEVKRSLAAEEKDSAKKDGEIARLQAAGSKTSPIDDYARIHAIVGKNDPAAEMQKVIAATMGEVIPQLIASAVGAASAAGGGADTTATLIREGIQAAKEVLAARAAQVQAAPSYRPQPVASAPAQSALPAPTGPKYLPGSAIPFDPTPAQSPAAAAQPAQSAPAAPAPASEAKEAPVAAPKPMAVVHPAAMALIRQAIQSGLNGGLFAKWLEDQPKPEHLVNSMLINAVIDGPIENVYNFAVNALTGEDKALLGSPAGRKWFDEFAGYIQSAAAEADAEEGDAPGDGSGEGGGQ